MRSGWLVVVRLWRRSGSTYIMKHSAICQCELKVKTKIVCSKTLDIDSGGVEPCWWGHAGQKIKLFITVTVVTLVTSAFHYDVTMSISSQLHQLGQIGSLWSTYIKRHIAIRQSEQKVKTETVCSETQGNDSGGGWAMLMRTSGTKHSL